MVEKFDGKNSFRLRHIKMHALLIPQDLLEAFVSKDKTYILISDEGKTTKRNKILAIFQLCLVDEVFIEVAYEKSIASLSLLPKVEALNHYKRWISL